MDSQVLSSDGYIPARDSLGTTYFADGLPPTRPELDMAVASKRGACGGHGRASLGIHRNSAGSRKMAVGRSRGSARFGSFHIVAIKRCSVSPALAETRSEVCQRG